MSSEVKSFLLDGSPGSTFTMVSHEDVRAVLNVTSARNLMRELQELLDRWKENSETNNALPKQDKAPIKSLVAGAHGQGKVENHRAQRDTKMKCLFLERMTHIESYWHDLNKLLEKGYKNTLCVISLLRRIEEVLKKVPTSRRAKLQARFSGLRAEAETIMDNVMDRVKIQCDQNPSRSNVIFHEHATSSQRSS